MTIKRTPLVAEGDREVAASLCRHLEKDGYRVFVGHDGLTAAALIRRKRPDVLLLDRRLLEADGLELHPVLASQRETAVVVLNAGTADNPERTDIHWGTSKSVGKPLEPCQVLSQLRAALRRIGTAGSGEPKKMLVADIVIDRCSHEVHVGGEVMHLILTEFNLLEALAGELGRAFTWLELLERVFGCDCEGLERTADTRGKDLRRKMEPDPTGPTYVGTVYGVGCRLTAAERDT